VLVGLEGRASARPGREESRPSAQIHRIRDLDDTSGYWSLFGAREVTIFWKRGLLRSGSHSQRR